MGQRIPWTVWGAAFLEEAAGAPGRVIWVAFAFWNLRDQATQGFDPGRLDLFQEVR
jgi:hypothetical protein